MYRASRYNREIVITVAQPRIRKFTRPTWAEVSLKALSRNFQTVQALVGADVQVCAVVKADAYGHGAAKCALALESAGAKWLGVTTTDEGVPLREAGVRSRILLMTGFWRGEEQEVVRRNLTATVWEREHVEALNRAAERLGAPPQPVHLKVDTGMGRLGVALDGLAAMCAAIKSSPRVALEGLFTHFASSEVLDAPDVSRQIESFETALGIVKENGLSPAVCHMDNTGGIFARPDTWKNMVRPGLALYGYALPLVRDGSSELPATAAKLEPVLSWRTRIISVKEMKAGQALGYGGTYVTKVASRIAALPVGYADGYNRGLSNRGQVIVRGAYAPIVGMISMDLTLVDVSNVPGADVGDEVLLIGSSSSARVTAPEIAKICGTIPYEILCGISKRVPRKFIT
jgi:alanine racemase